MTAPILRDFNPPAIIAALEANLEKGYIRLGQTLGAEFHHEPDALWFVTGIPLQVPNGTALTLAAMLEGLAGGYQVAGLQSSEMGLPIYQSLGFRDYCTFGTCFSPGGQEE